MYLPFAVYILKCTNEQFYVGYTKNIDRRLEEHRRGEVHYTQDKLPVTLVHLSLFAHKRAAHRYERYLKSGSGKAFRRRHLI